MIKRYAKFSARHALVHRALVILWLAALAAITGLLLWRERIALMLLYVPLFATLLFMARVAKYRQRYLHS